MLVSMWLLEPNKVRVVCLVEKVFSQLWSLGPIMRHPSQMVSSLVNMSHANLLGLHQPANSKIFLIKY